VHNLASRGEERNRRTVGERIEEVVAMDRRDLEAVGGFGRRGLAGDARTALAVRSGDDPDG